MFAGTGYCLMSQTAFVFTVLQSHHHRCPLFALMWWSFECWGVSEFKQVCFVLFLHVNVNTGRLEHMQIIEYIWKSLVNYDCYRTAAAALYLAHVVSLVSLVRQVTETGTVLLPVYKNMQKKGTVRVSYDSHIFLQSFSSLDSGGAASQTCLHNKQINENSLVERLMLWTLTIWKRQKQEGLRGQSQHLADGVVTELGELLSPFF